MPAHRTTLPRHPHPPPYPHLGRRLRAARRATPGLSVALLAAALGVTPATIYGYEAGQHRPRRATLQRLAAVLGLDREDLLTLAGYPARRGAGDDPPRRDDHAAVTSA
jgi:transcriptional regulator with XRE-family HTH domain